MYEKASRRKLNWEKTSLFFSRNMKEEAKAFILSIAGFSSTQRFEKYLRLPALVGRSKVGAFTEIKGRVWKE